MKSIAESIHVKGDISRWLKAQYQRLSKGFYK